MGFRVWGLGFRVECLMPKDEARRAPERRGGGGGEGYSAPLSGKGLGFGFGGPSPITPKPETLISTLNPEPQLNPDSPNPTDYIRAWNATIP